MNLNEVIRYIQGEYSLSADTRNALHGATEGHPWCEGKTLDQRKQEAAFAVGAKIANNDLERIFRAKT